MSENEAETPKNSQNTDADDEYAGRVVRCPECGGKISVTWSKAAGLAGGHMLSCQCAVGPALPLDAEEDFYEPWLHVRDEILGEDDD